MPLARAHFYSGEQGQGPIFSYDTYFCSGRIPPCCVRRSASRSLPFPLVPPKSEPLTVGVSASAGLVFVFFAATFLMAPCLGARGRGPLPYGVPFTLQPCQSCLGIYISAPLSAPHMTSVVGHPAHVLRSDGSCRPAAAAFLSLPPCGSSPSGPRSLLCLSTYSPLPIRSCCICIPGWVFRPRPPLGLPLPGRAIHPPYEAWRRAYTARSGGRPSGPPSCLLSGRRAPSISRLPSPPSGFGARRFWLLPLNSPAPPP